MTEIEQKALELVNEVSEVQGVWFSRDVGPLHETLCRAIEQHEAFRQKVSDAVEEAQRGNMVAPILHQFIITKPDPLVEAMRYITAFDDAKAAEQLRAELAKRGLEIREKGE